jgi:ATP-dependent Clp protease ATP-binding subunit ClpC
MKMKNNMRYLKKFEAQDGPSIWRSFGKDLTELAKNGELEPVIGRQKELDQLMWVLLRKQKNNPVLIGEPGVGKTAAVEKLAQVIASGDCPAALKDKKVIEIDINAVVQSNMLDQLIEEVKEQGLILFMDEIHTIMPSANKLKPALARGVLPLIGATTLAEFRGSIEKDGAVERRFQKVFVGEPSLEECYEILKGIQARYEAHHGVQFSDESIKACVRLSHRYITDRFLPDKAIDLMDEVGAKVRLSRTKNPKVKELEEKILQNIEESKRLARTQKYTELAANKDERDALKVELESLKGADPVVTITKEMVEDIVQLKTDIPIRMAQGEKETVKQIGSKLKMHVIGQDEAVNTVSRAIKRIKVGLSNKNRPMGVFLFLGPTGVGKTHLVKSLAKEVMGSVDNIIRLDMSEFDQPHTTSRLFGSPPGYVGYGEGGQLTEKVRRKPYSIVLLDEIEKADPKVFDSFLQVFDEGHLTDGEGRKVNFKNTIIVMTSNIGTKAAAEVKTSGNSAAADEMRKRAILGELQNFLRPEFLNRIDDIIVFKSLDKDSLHKIVDGELKIVADRLKERDVELTWTPLLKDFVLQYGYDPSMGARPLKRAIQKHIEDPITDAILDDRVSDKISLDAEEIDGIYRLVINGEIIMEKKRYLTRLFDLFRG